MKVLDRQNRLYDRLIARDSREVTLLDGSKAKVLLKNGTQNAAKTNENFSVYYPHGSAIHKGSTFAMSGEHFLAINQTDWDSGRYFKSVAEKCNAVWQVGATTLYLVVGQNGTLTVANGTAITTLNGNIIVYGSENDALKIDQYIYAQGGVYKVTGIYNVDGITYYYLSRDVANAGAKFTIAGVSDTTLDGSQTVTLKPYLDNSANDGIILAEPEYAYSSSNSTICSVSKDGTLTAVANGTATITITMSYFEPTSRTTYSASKTITVTVAMATPAITYTLSFTGSEVVELGYGETADYSYELVGSDGSKPEGVTYTYSSSNDEYATISDKGIVTSHAYGYTVTVTCVATYKGIEYTNSKEIALANHSRDYYFELASDTDKSDLTVGSTREVTIGYYRYDKYGVGQLVNGYFKDNDSTPSVGITYEFTGTHNPQTFTVTATNATTAPIMRVRFFRNGITNVYEDIALPFNIVAKEVNYNYTLKRTNSSTSVTMGSTLALGYYVEKSGDDGSVVTDSATISYTSSAESVATVSSDGTVTPVTAGTATITVNAVTSANTTLTDSVEITVNSAWSPTYYLKYTGNLVTPMDYESTNNIWSYVVAYLDESNVEQTVSGADVTYLSTNTNVATINASGIVKPLTKGTVTLMASATYNGAELSKSLDLEITDDTYSLVANSGNATTVNVGETGSAIVTLHNDTDNTTVDTTITYATSNENIATVDSTGTVTGVAEGSVTITATATYHGASYSLEQTISIIEAVTGTPHAEVRVYARNILNSSSPYYSSSGEWTALKRDLYPAEGDVTAQQALPMPLTGDNVNTVHYFQQLHKQDQVRLQLVWIDKNGNIDNWTTSDGAGILFDSCYNESKIKNYIDGGYDIETNTKPISTDGYWKLNSNSTLNSNLSASGFYISFDFYAMTNTKGDKFDKVIKMFFNR